MVESRWLKWKFPTTAFENDGADGFAQFAQEQATGSSPEPTWA
jgi:hypothetical protein